MKAILVLAFTVFFYKGTSCKNIQSKLLNQPFTFPGNASDCNHAEWRKILPKDATIATCKKRMCMPEKGFEDEFRCEDNHLLLKSANYNDKGSYEFICDGDKTQIKLDVLYAPNVSAVEMDNITLNCYAENAEDVTWLHNNKNVMHSKMDGSMNSSKDYEGRASLEKDWFKTGDLSLTITGVHKADAGTYRCFADDETVKGNPHAYVLHVNEKRSSPGDQTDCNKIIILTVVFGLISVISVITNVITIKLHKPQSTSDVAIQNSEEDTTENVSMLMPAIGTTSPTSESQSVESSPIQESNFTENKSSNTRPF
ncbi:hypothetical protein Q8A67_008221 [Cirrhinus molitorella]|uniref:Ig-like domain-containing protein n=1 Tax=Cirrhinus molitorella TaxID=172907 RepID=A0AA88PWD2_9TELE|nr:hypothetical protein Q8A67_008221 [Cirrhinus molitorella]